MPPKGSKKGSASSSGSGSKATSPTKATATGRKASVTKPKSPSKDGISKRTSPGKRTISPSKQTTSPEKPVAYKATMTRATRAASAAPSGSAVGNTKPVLQKRGILGTNDNDDDPTQPTEEMLAAFNKRSLTPVDKFLIERIHAMEEDEDLEVLDDGIKISEQEMQAASNGLPLDCHTKIYWRFLDMFARKNDGRYPSDLFRKGRNPGTTRSPAKPAARAASRSTVQASPARQASANVRRSPERQQAPMSRPMRGESSKSPQSSSRATSSQVAGSSRISKSDAGPSAARGATSSRMAARALAQEGFRAEDALKSYEQTAFAELMAGRPMPPPPRDPTVPRGEFFAAQERARLASKAELAAMVSESEDEPTPPIVKVAKRPQSRTPSPSKVRNTSRPASPAKPHTHVRPKSPATQPSVRQPALGHPDAFPREPGRGILVSSQNPKKIMIKRDGKKAVEEDNPFHETMPAPEVWHRRMPPVFPFGETPFMARVVSDQINADLSRNHADDGNAAPAQSAGFISRGARTFQSGLSNVVKALSPTKATASEAEKAKKIPSVWDLPKVDESLRKEIEHAAARFNKAHRVPHHFHDVEERTHAPHKRARVARHGEGRLF